jgi:hypothetical protein
MESNESTPKRRPGLFGPLFLIALGVIFLLNNLGVVQGSFWNALIQLWPVLLILISLDSIYRGEGMVGAAFMMGLGVVFLLANLGLLVVDVWRVVLRLWPILLIAIGFDVIVGRKSRLGSLVGVVVVLAVLAAALWWIGVVPGSGGQAVASEQISQSLEGATRARVTLSPAAGQLRLSAMDSQELLISGEVDERPFGGLNANQSVDDGLLIYTLRDRGGQFVFTNQMESSWEWDLQLTTAVPIDLQTNMGAGQMLLDLSQLQLTALETNLGAGDVQVTLPEGSDFSGKLEAAVGQIVIIVPEGVGVSVDTNTLLVSVKAPDNYSGNDGRYTSPGYDSADFQVELEVGLVIGSVSIQEE